MKENLLNIILSVPRKGCSGVMGFYEWCVHNEAAHGPREQAAWCKDSHLWQWLQCPLFFRASALAPLTELTSLPWGRKKETLFQQNGWYGHYMIKIPKDLSREICFIDRYIKTVGVGGGRSTSWPGSRYSTKILNFLSRRRGRKEGPKKKFWGEMEKKKSTEKEEES